MYCTTCMYMYIIYIYIYTVHVYALNGRLCHACCGCIDLCEKTGVTCMKLVYITCVKLV